MRERSTPRCNAHGLIKVRVFSTTAPRARRMLARARRRLGAAPIQHIGKLLVLWRPVPPKERVEREEPRMPGPKVVKMLKFSKSGNHRPQVKKITVLGNMRLAAGGSIKRAKKRASERQEAAQRLTRPAVQAANRHASASTSTVLSANERPLTRVQRAERPGRPARRAPRPSAAARAKCAGDRAEQRAAAPAASRCSTEPPPLAGTPRAPRSMKQQQRERQADVGLAGQEPADTRPASAGASVANGAGAAKQAARTATSPAHSQPAASTAQPAGVTRRQT